MKSSKPKDDDDDDDSRHSTKYAWMITWHGCPVGFDDWFPQILQKAIDNWFFKPSWKVSHVFVGSSSPSSSSSTLFSNDTDSKDSNKVEEEEVVVAYPLLEQCIPELIDFHKEEGNERWAAGRAKGWLSGDLCANFIILPNTASSTDNYGGRNNNDDALSLSSSSSSSNSKLLFLLCYWIHQEEDGLISGTILNQMKENDKTQLSGAIHVVHGMSAPGSISWKTETHVSLLIFSTSSEAEKHILSLRAFEDTNKSIRISMKYFEIKANAVAPTPSSSSSA